MSQSKVTSFYVARKNASKQSIKGCDLVTPTEYLKDGSLSISKSNATRKNTKNQNINKEHSKLTSHQEECAKNASSSNLATIVQETTQKKINRLDKKSNDIETSVVVKNTVKTKRKVQKKDNKTKDEADLSQSKVTSFYGTRETTKKLISKEKHKITSNVASTIIKEKGALSVLDEIKKHKKDAEFKEASEVVFPSGDKASSSQLSESAINVQSASSEVKIKQLKCDEVFAKSKYLQASKYSPIKSPSKTSHVPEDCTRLLSLKLKGIGMMKELNNIKSDLQPNVLSSLGEDLTKSPKRHLTDSIDGTPPKKKLPSTVEHTTVDSPRKISKISPRKLFNEEITTDIRRVKDQINCYGLSEEMQKNIAIFKKKLDVIKNNEKNQFSVTSVVSSVLQNSDSQPTLPTAAHERYSYLVDPDSSLILPKKHKLLLEMFRSLDTVVSMLNNRNEKITFDKVREGVQKIMKRNFSQNHLGQIVTVMPSAYNITLEKNNYKKSYELDYQMIISPILKTKKGNIRKARNVTMTPQDLSSRKTEFHSQLLNRVILRHEEFLNRLNFPPIPVEKLRRWHPQFKVDLVPDIESAALPEIPETKVFSAKDVLKKFTKGSLNEKEKLVKALKSVAEESPSANTIESKPFTGEEPKKSTSNSALKGICSDLLAKVRARESAKLLETMTEKPEETKRKAMLELLPEIVQILWHYFISERKAAVPVDTAIEKIIHSSCSLSTHEKVKAHLKLISEVYPDWLFFIQIPKGLYIKINKSKNITEMLDGSGCL